MRSNWQSFCVRLPGSDPASIVERAARDGVGLRRGVSNAHEQPAYAVPSSHRVAGTLAESERAWRETICLPLYPEMTRGEQERVAAVLFAAKDA